MASTRVISHRDELRRFVHENLFVTTHNPDNWIFSKCAEPKITCQLLNPECQNSQPSHLANRGDVVSSV